MQPVAKKAQISLICSEISAYLWNQREKSYIFKESVMKKFRISVANNEKVRIMKIFRKQSRINKIK